MRATKKTIEYVNKTKQDAMKYLAEAREDVALWTMIVNECDADLKAISQKNPPMYGKARIKVMTAIVLFLMIVWLASCNLVQGAGEDITWMGKAGQKMLQEGHKIE